MPTPNELDRITNAMLGKPRCGECGRKCRNFTALVDHMRDEHPGTDVPSAQA
jgi:hypothetical protein